MNTRIFLLAAGAAVGALAATGCSPRDDDPARPVARSESDADRALDRAADSADHAADAATSAAKRAGDTLSDAWDDISDSTYADRDRVRTSAENLSRSVDTKIEELEARARSGSGAASESWNRSMEQLRTARADLRREIAELEDASAENWAEAKAQLADAWNRVHQSFTELEAQRTAP